MSGYSDKCHEAVIRGKSLDILFFDRSDVEDIIGNKDNEGVKFTEVLIEKLFAASQTGNVHRTWRELVKNQKTSSFPMFIYCEGRTDEIWISSLLRYARQKEHLDVNKVSVISANGVRSIPSLIQLFITSTSEPRSILVIADEDKETRVSISEFRKLLESILFPSTWKYQFIAVAPNLTEPIENMGRGLRRKMEEKEQIEPFGTQVLKIDWYAEAMKWFDWSEFANKIKEVEDILIFLREYLPRVPEFS